MAWIRDTPFSKTWFAAFFGAVRNHHYLLFYSCRRATLLLAGAGAGNNPNLDLWDFGLKKQRKN